MHFNKKEKETIETLKNSSPSEQDRLAIDLAKNGRWDILGAANVTGLFERLKENPEWNKITDDQKEWVGFGAAKELWDGDKDLREEFENNFDVYVAYCQAIDSGLVRGIKNYSEDLKAQ